MVYYGYNTTRQGENSMKLKQQKQVEEILARWSFAVDKVVFGADNFNTDRVTFKASFFSQGNWDGPYIDVEWALEALDHKLYIAYVAPKLDTLGLLESMTGGKDGSYDLRYALVGAWKELADLRF